MNDNPSTADEMTSTPSATVRCGPKRSLIIPMKGAATPLASCRSENASAVAATPQPNSARSGWKIVPKPELIAPEVRVI